MSGKPTNDPHPQKEPVVDAGDRVALDTLAIPTPGHGVIALCMDARQLEGIQAQRGRKALDTLPEQMIVAIDGPARGGKNTAGELVAEAIGGVLVDSGRFYRSLTAAALRAGINLDDAEAIGKFCDQALIYVRLDRDGGSIIEALVTVNGRCYSKAELNEVGGVTPRLAGVPPGARADQHRVAIVARLGKGSHAGPGHRRPRVSRDSVQVFSERTRAHSRTAPSQHDRKAGRCGSESGGPPQHHSHTILTPGALEIDTSIIPPSAVCDTILVHLLLRANGDQEAAI